MNEEKLIVKSALVAKSETTAGRYSIWASTNQLDSQGDIIEPEAFKNLSDYLKKYPRILYNHSWVNWSATDEETLPIGKATAGKIVPGKGLVLDFEFSPLPLAQKIKTLVDLGFPMFASVGGFVREFVEEKTPEGNMIRHIKNFYLIETSITAIPANEGAEFIRSLSSDPQKSKELKAAGLAVADIEKVLDEVVKYGVAKAGMSEKDKALGLADSYLKNKR